MKSMRTRPIDYVAKSRERIQVHDKSARDYQISEGSVIPQLGDLGLTTSRALNMIVLYCDLRGYTARVEQSREATMVRILDMFLREMVLIVEDFQGVLGDFQGDRIMALFPNPQKLEKTHWNAVEAAVMMQTVVQEVINSILNRIQQDPLQCGIGIDSGRVLATRLGPKSGKLERNQLVYIGRPANIAAKLEDQAKGGEVLISELIYFNLPEYMKEPKLSWNWTKRGTIQDITYYGCSGCSFKIK